MGFDPKIHHRRSIRLKGYDYSEPGLYFVTVCTWRRACLFGRIQSGKMILNEAGQAVQAAWFNIRYRFPGIHLDAFLVMPNHIHGVIGLLHAKGAVPRNTKAGGAASSAPTTSISLGRVMRAFKSESAIEVNRLLRREGRPLWQRNYYEHIIRKGNDLDEIQRYIEENPAKWAEDPENPATQSRP